MPPIMDVATNPYTGHPVIAVSTGTGGRMLAYTSKRTMDEGESGIIATQGWTSGTSTSTSGFASAEKVTPTIAYTESARRVGEGVISGVGALSRYGYSKYSEYRMPDERAQKTELSKSAPAGRGYLLQRTHTDDQTENIRQPLPRSRDAQTIGTVVVLDLVASERNARRQAGVAPETIIAHFCPSHAHATTLLSFSPNGSSILTASSEAHCFHIFELRSKSVFGKDSDTDRLRSSSPGKVWHRYRLNRGFTTAQAMTASWFPDGRMAAVQTASGTSHIYAINPQGGQVSDSTHAKEQVQNEVRLAPLSVNMEAIARIRMSNASMVSQHTQAQSPVSAKPDVRPSIGESRVARPAEVLFLPHSDVPASFAYAAHSRSTAVPAGKREVNLAYFYPHIEEVLLATLTLGGPGVVATVYTAAAPLANKAASSAMSGLSKLMRQQDLSVSPPSPARKSQDPKPALSAAHERRAFWPFPAIAATIVPQSGIKAYPPAARVAAE